jgi:hypothetical protein
MYTSFRARNYRCFFDLTVEPLGQINLIAGKNNVGKTALLEALWLHKGYHNPELEVRVNAFRGLTVIKKEEFLWDLFKDFDPERVIELSSLDSSNQSRLLRVSVREHPISRVALNNANQEARNGQEFPTSEVTGQETTKLFGTELLLEYTDGDQPPIQARAVIEGNKIEFHRAPGIKEPSGVFLAARRPLEPEGLAERFSRLAVAKRKGEIVRMLKIIEPRLKDLSVEQTGGAMIYGDIGVARLIPLSLMGDGIGRFLDIALGIPVAQDGIFLVDEIENGLHYSVMIDVWKAIANWAQEYAVQVFATTHSRECIEAAHQAFGTGEVYDFRLHRLDWINGKIQAVSYSRDELAIAVQQAIEVR